MGERDERDEKDERRAAAASAVRARGVRHAYVPDREDLRGVDLDVGRGELVAVVGENGSGKTTLARHLDALIALQAGSLTVAGLDAADPALTWELRRACGMVFQNPENQLVSSVVGEDVAFGPRNFGRGPAEARAAASRALAAVGLAGFERRDAHALSGGQQQRVALAAVLACEPEVVVLDEATSMIDPQGSDELAAAVARARRECGCTVIWVTHDMELAARADRVVVMAAGRVLASGAPGAVLTDGALLAEAGLEPPLAARTWRALELAGAADGACPVTTSGLVRAVRSGVPALGEKPAPATRETRGERPAVPGSSARGERPARAVRLALEGVGVVREGGDGAVRALDGVTLELAGGVTALMGQTGSGKTTLLEVMAGALRPDAGRVLLDGADAARGAGAQARAAAAGLVFQQPERQFFEPTVEREVTFVLRARGVGAAEARERASAALACLGLDLSELAVRSPLSLSGGQQRRVALASVLVARPRLLLLDEPTAGLDPRSRAACLAAVRSAAADGATVVMATHDANAAAEVADRVVALDAGRVTLDGPARELLADAPLMRASGLEPCCAARAACALRSAGVPVPGAPLTASELAAALLTGRAS